MNYKEVQIQIEKAFYDELLSILYFNDNLLGIKEDLDFKNVDPYLNEEPINTKNTKTLTIYLKKDTDISFIPQIYQKLTIDNKTYVPNNNWKKHFKTIYINDVIIKPSWEISTNKTDTDKANNNTKTSIKNINNKKTQSKKIEIIIDPGMAFGTGLHHTTQGIIEFLSIEKEKLKDKDIIDIGCGTGILSIIACKYGAKLTAIDMDIQAIQEAKENFKINKCSNINITHSNIQEFMGKTKQNKTVNQLRENNITQNNKEKSFRETKEMKKTFDIVMANIISSILIKNKTYLLNLVDKTGTLVLAGLLLKEKDKIIKHFSSYFTKHKEIIKDEWISIIFENKIDKR